ncbi:hypothetical protein MRX96_007640 [Rhipicephalus microplus]
MRVFGAQVGRTGHGLTGTLYGSVPNAAQNYLGSAVPISSGPISCSSPSTLFAQNETKERCDVRKRPNGKNGITWVHAKPELVSTVGFCEEFIRRADTGGRSRESGREGENGEEGCDASLFRKSWDPAALSWDPASRSAATSLLSDGGLERKVYNRRRDSATEAPPRVAPSFRGPVKCRRGRVCDRTETLRKYKRPEKHFRRAPGKLNPVLGVPRY